MASEKFLFETFLGVVLRPVEEILDRLKEVRGLTKGHGSDVALGKSLNIRKQVIANWKLRKEIAWKTLMEVLTPEEFRGVYEWAIQSDTDSNLVKEVTPPFPSKAIEGSDLEAAERIVDEQLLKGRSVSKDMHRRLVSLVLDELVGLRSQGRENELHRKIDRWLDAAEILRSKPKSK